MITVILWLVMVTGEGTDFVVHSQPVQEYKRMEDCIKVGEALLSNNLVHGYACRQETTL